MSTNKNTYSQTSEANRSPPKGHELQCFSIDDVDDMRFFKFPQKLLRDPAYRDLSMSAKVLYGVLYDRAELSRKNHWNDSDGKVYIYYPIDDIAELMCLSKTTVVKCLQELEVFRLIKKIRQGLGRPSKIYVFNTSKIVTYDNETLEFQNLASEKQESVNPEVQNFIPSKTDNNNTNNNKTYPSSSDGDDLFYRNCQNTNFQFSVERVERNVEALPASDEEMLMRNIDFAWFQTHDGEKRNWKDDDGVRENYKISAGMVREIIKIMIATLDSKKPTIRIGQEDIPIEKVRNSFMSLGRGDIEKIVRCIQNSSKQIKNIRQYTLAMLYNAGQTAALTRLIEESKKELQKNDLIMGRLNFDLSFQGKKQEP